MLVFLFPLLLLSGYTSFCHCIAVTSLILYAHSLVHCVADTMHWLLGEIGAIPQKGSCRPSRRWWRWCVWHTICYALHNAIPLLAKQLQNDYSHVGVIVLQITSFKILICKGILHSMEAIYSVVQCKKVGQFREEAIYSWLVRITHKTSPGSIALTLTWLLCPLLSSHSLYPYFPGVPGRRDQRKGGGGDGTEAAASLGNQWLQTVLGKGKCKGVLAPPNIYRWTFYHS